HRAARLGTASPRSAAAEVVASHRCAGHDGLGGTGPDPSVQSRGHLQEAAAAGANPRDQECRPSAARGEGAGILRARVAFRWRKSMNLVLFHLMPYADLDLEAGRKNG